MGLIDLISLLPSLETQSR